MQILTHRIIENTNIAGPGRRFCLWVQGCKRHCAGCYASDTWDQEDGYLLSTEEIMQDIRDTVDIEGITFLGGEPFDQAKGLSEIGKESKMLGLSVVTFTGYTLEELKESDNNDFFELLAATDLLIDGPFQLDKKNLDRPWVGSSNQRYIFLTKRYSDADISPINNKLEVRIFPNGKTIVAGMGDFISIQKSLG